MPKKSSYDINMQAEAWGTHRSPATGDTLIAAKESDVDVSLRVVRARDRSPTTVAAERDILLQMMTSYSRVDPSRAATAATNHNGPELRFATCEPDRAGVGVDWDGAEQLSATED